MKISTHELVAKLLRNVWKVGWVDEPIYTEMLNRILSATETKIHPKFYDFLSSKLWMSAQLSSESESKIAILGKCCKEKQTH